MAMAAVKAATTFQIVGTCKSPTKLLSSLFPIAWSASMFSWEHSQLSVQPMLTEWCLNWMPLCFLNYFHLCCPSPWTVVLSVLWNFVLNKFFYSSFKCSALLFSDIWRQQIPEFCSVIQEAVVFASCTSAYVYIASSCLAWGSCPFSDFHPSL